MSHKSRDGKTHQSTILIGENGLPIDGIATIAGSYIFLESSVDPLIYTAIAATVTLPVTNDLTPVVTAKARYTGRYVLITKDNSIYYINRQSIDVGARTFVISRSDSSQITPASIDLSPGWVVAEADIVNRLATTSSAKIDSVEFRDMHFQMQLDGDPVTLLNQDGVGINPATEEKQDDIITELGLANDSLDEIELRLETFDTNNGPTTLNTLRTSSNITDEAGSAFTDANYMPVGQSTHDNLNSNANVQQNNIDVSATNALYTQANNLISTLNSTVTPLLAGATFTGGWENCAHYASINITIKSNVNSALNGLVLEFSTNQTTVIRNLTSTFIGASNGVYFSIPVEAVYYRLVYTNGAVNQTTFEVDTILTKGQTGAASVPVATPITDATSTLITRSVLTGKSVDGSYMNQRAAGVSTLNSTSTPLGANGTFTGAWEDVLGYTNIAITLNSDQNSATNGLIIEASTDGINVDDSDVFTVPLNNGNQLTFGVVARYFRLRYINGPVAQASFRLATIFHIAAPKPSSHRIDDPINGQNDAELSKSVITGKNPDGIFVNEEVSGVVSSNSTTTPLGIGGVFQAPYFDNAGFIASSFFCLTDQAGTLVIETSDDGSTVIRTSTFTLIANQPFYVAQTSVGRYTRARVTNTSGIAQTTLRLQTLLKTSPISATALTIAEPLSSNAVAINTRSILAGQQENGTFSNVGLSNTASIKVAVTDRPSEVRNRVKVEARIFNTALTGTATVLHTVTGGKTFYLESMVISGINTANAIGEWRITDGVTDKLGYLMGEKTTGAAATSTASSPALPEPIPFTTSFGVREVSGDVFLSIYIIGYEE